MHPCRRNPQVGAGPAMRITSSPGTQHPSRSTSLQAVMAVKAVKGPRSLSTGRLGGCIVARAVTDHSVPVPVGDLEQGWACLPVQIVALRASPRSAIRDLAEVQGWGQGLRKASLLPAPHDTRCWRLDRSSRDWCLPRSRPEMANCGRCGVLLLGGVVCAGEVRSWHGVLATCPFVAKLRGVRVALSSPHSGVVPGGCADALGGSAPADGGQRGRRDPILLHAVLLLRRHASLRVARQGQGLYI